jgi:hypothetical protein
MPLDDVPKTYESAVRVLAAAHSVGDTSVRPESVSIEMD